MATTAAYFRVLGGRFVFDDTPGIVLNVALKYLGAYLQAVAQGLARGGRPMTELTFAVNYHFGGLDPWGYHAVNLALHLGVVLLVFAFTRRLLELADAGHPHGVALLVAALFALHPIQSQAVAYVSQRAEVLCSGFYLATLLLLLLAERLGKSWKGGLSYAGALAVYVLALGSKAVALTAPVAYLLLTWAIPSTARRSTLATFGARLFLAIPLFVLGLVSTTGLVQSIGSSTTVGLGAEGLSPVTYFLTQWKVVVTYLGLLVFPVGQTVDWDMPIATSLFDPPVLASGLFLAVLATSALVLSVRARRQASESGAAARVFAFGVLWFFLVLSVTSSVMPLVDVAMEHRLYLASWGLFAAAAVAGERAWARWGKGLPAWLAPATAGAVLLLLALGLHARNAVWESPFALWSDAVAKSPQKARPHFGLAMALRERGEIAGAVREFEAALQGTTSDPTYHLLVLRNLGATLLLAGRTEEAIATLERILRESPDFVDAHITLTSAKLLKGDVAGAEVHARRALELAPQGGQSEYVLGLVLMAKRDVAGAIELFRRSVQANSDIGERHVNLGVAYAELGQTARACESWQRALELGIEPGMRKRTLQRTSSLGCPVLSP